MKLKKTRHDDYVAVVRFPVFANFGIYIVFTDDLAKSRVARYGSSASMKENVAASFVISPGMGYGHIFLRPEACAKNIAHESLHAIRALFHWAGVTEMDEEVYAYHLGYLVGKVSEFQAIVLAVKSNRRGQS